MEQERFRKIGYTTMIGKRSWAGPVVATPDALYCVLAVANGLGDSLKVGIGGALGGAIGGLIVGALTATTAAAPPTVTTVADVPSILRMPGKGPLRRHQLGTRVLVIPRGAAGEIVKDSWLNNTLKMQVGEERVVICHSLFGGAKVREYLAGAGWRLSWRGQRFNG